MPRKPIIYTCDHPYHVTGRSNNRDWFDLPLNYCYGIFSNVIVKTKEMYGFKIHAFVLMNNHYHMILTTPGRNISAGMRYFMTESARGIRVRSQRINHVYGGRYRPSLILTAEYYAQAFKYVYRNPVMAGLCQQVENYQWSTISRQTRRLSSEIEPILTGHGVHLPIRREDQIKWLNEPNSMGVDQQVGRAMHRQIFEIKPDRKNRRVPKCELP